MKNLFDDEDALLLVRCLRPASLARELSQWK